MRAGEGFWSTDTITSPTCEKKTTIGYDAGLDSAVERQVSWVSLVWKVNKKATPQAPSYVVVQPQKIGQSGERLKSNEMLEN